VTRVVIADDHPMMVEALRASLTGEGLEVVGATQYGAEVVGLVEATQPDVLLLDLVMPDRSGLDCLAALRERMPDVKVIVLSGLEDQASIDAALATGAVCYVRKDVDSRDLAAMVRIMATNAPIYAVGRSGAPAPAGEPSAGSAAAGIGLTRREGEIVELVQTGMSNAEMANTLFVTEQTIKFHLSNIYRKLGVSNRTQAAARARGLGLPSAGPSD
jgi:DNA-binding NarL/FixJ family response regulator